MAKKKTSKRKKNPAKRKPEAQATSDSTQKKTRIPRIEESPFPLTFWRNYRWGVLIAALLALVIYLPTVQYDFVLDDGIVLSQNNFTKKGLAGIADLLTKETFEGYFGEQKNLLVGARYRPLSLIFFAAEYELFGLNPAGYHILNIVYYLLAIAMLMIFLATLFPSWIQGGALWQIPLLTTVLFTVHPVHVEVVANIKSRDEILCMLFGLTSCYMALKFYYSQRWIFLFGAGVSLILALLAKETAAAFIVLIPMALWLFTAFRKRPTGWVLGMIGVVIVGYIALRYQAIGYIKGVDPESLSIMNNPFKGMDFGERTATIFYTLLLYIKLLFFPHPLTHDYYPYHIPIMDWKTLGSVIGLLLYVIIGLVGSWGLVKRKSFAYGVFFYLIPLGIVSNLLFPVGTFMNERFLFLPSIGFALLIAQASVWIVQKWPQYRKWIYGLFALLVLGFAIRSILRVPVWENRETLNSASIAVSKGSARANLFYGTLLFERVTQGNLDNQQKAQLLDEASFYFQRSSDILPSYSEPVRMMAGVAAEQYRIDNNLDQLLERFYQTIQKMPQVAYVQQYMEYLNNRGIQQDKLINFYYVVGFEYLINQRKLYDLGLKYLNYGLQLDESNSRIRNAVGQTYQRLGDQTNAAKYLN